MIKKDMLKGAAAGACITLLVMGVSVTALAASRSITIDEGVKVTVNGTALLPKDAKGSAVPVFSYDGTVYVPARALGDAMGFSVQYDSAAKTAAFTGRPDAVSSATVPVNENYIGVEKAKTLALKHAGLTAEKATFVKARLDMDNGKAIYEVEFYSGSKEYDYELDALTGAVLSYDYDAEYLAPGQAGSYIGVEKAKAAAQAKAPKATIVKCELDIEDGRAVYQLELREGAIEYECEIDAVTGAVLQWEKD